MKHSVSTLLAGIAGAVLSVSAMAAEKINVAIGQKGLWDTMITVHGVEQGFFPKQGLEVEITWTKGGSETLQAVITGSAQYALANGTLGVLGAFAKGAPLRIVSAQMTGAPDLFWYVKKDSPIQSMKDTGGKTFGFSRPGSSTHLVGLALASEAGVEPKMTSTGGIPATRTQVMSNQVDVGWSVPPFNLDLVNAGDARIVAKGGDVKSLANQTIRVNVVNADYLAKSPESVAKFVRAYQQTIDWMYANPDKAAASYATFNKVDLAVAKSAIEFYPKSSLVISPVSGLDASMAEALENKNLTQPLSAEQVQTLVQIPNI